LSNVIIVAVISVEIDERGFVLTMLLIVAPVAWFTEITTLGNALL